MMLRINLTLAALMFVTVAQANAQYKDVMPYKIKALEQADGCLRWEATYEKGQQVNTTPLIKLLKLASVGYIYDGQDGATVTGNVVEVRVKIKGQAKNARQLQALEFVNATGNALVQYRVTYSYLTDEAEKAAVNGVAVADALSRGHKEDAKDGINVAASVKKEKDEDKAVLTLRYTGGPYGK